MVPTLLATLAVAVAAIIPELRALLGFIAVVLVPGFLAAGLVYGSGLRSAPFWMMALLLGTSLVILVGMLLSASPFGLQGLAVIGAVVLAVLVGLLFNPALARGKTLWIPRVSLSGASLAMIVVAALIVSGSVVLAVRSAEASPSSTLWQLWMIERASQQIEVGAAAAAGPSGTVSIELRAGGQALRHWDAVHLEGGARWTEMIASSTIPRGTSRLILVMLSKDGEIVREATLDIGGSN